MLGYGSPLPTITPFVVPPTICRNGLQISSPVLYLAHVKTSKYLIQFMFNIFCESLWPIHSVMAKTIKKKKTRICSTARVNQQQRDQNASKSVRRESDRGKECGIDMTYKSIRSTGMQSRERDGISVQKTEKRPASGAGIPRFWRGKTEDEWGRELIVQKSRPGQVVSTFRLCSRPGDESRRAGPAHLVQFTPRRECRRINLQRGIRTHTNSLCGEKMSNRQWHVSLFIRRGCNPENVMAFRAENRKEAGRGAEKPRFSKKETKMLAKKLSSA